MEYLSRGLVAVEEANGVFLSWRILVTDTVGAEFNLYRNDTLVNAAPVSGLSNFLDTAGTASSIYYLETILGGTDTSFSAPATVWAKEYMSIPTQTPDGYTINDGSVADLDGDGELEFVLKMENSTRDNSQSGFTDPVYLHAYRMNGELMWRINLGINIRGGAHYTQFMVYDLDGNGKAEVACKTAPGTTDGLGNFLSKGPAANDDDAADYRNGGGYILSGPEYLTVFDGVTGEEISTVYYTPGRHPTTENPTSGQLNVIWGDGYGNRVDRFLACVAYFEETPSLVMCRGYYTRTALTAYDFDGDSLTIRWIFDTYNNASLSSYEGQGAHSLSVGDADGDGKDEIMYGAMAVDDDGTPLHNTNYLHGDATHFSDLDPANPGLEFYMPSETAGWTHDGVTNPTVHVRDAATGSILWEIPGSGDIGRAMTADISDATPGYEFWASSGIGLFDSQGQSIPGSRPSINFGIWWDGDLSRELLDNNHIDKWTPGGIQRILTANGATSNNGTKATPTLSGDILGDWREELILPAADEQSIRIYTTTTPTTYGWYTLLQDPQYRLALTWQNVAYNQPPHPGFFLGNGMTAPPVPSLQFSSPMSAINIQNPQNGTELAIGEDLTITLYAAALADTNRDIVLLLDGTPVDTLESPSYFTTLTGLAPGQHILTATGIGADGLPVQSSPVMFSVDLGAPEIMLLTPVEGMLFTISDSIGYSAEANDVVGVSGAGIDSVGFYLEDSLIAVVTSVPYEFTLPNPGPGVYKAKAKAWDVDGFSTWSDSVMVQVGISTFFQENEAGFCGFLEGAGSIDSIHTGFTGSGFADPDDISGAGVRYSVNVPEAGEYILEWRYASLADRPVEVLLDGTTVLGTLPMAATGSWVFWETNDLMADLPQGDHEISLRATNVHGMGIIDYLNVISLQTSSVASPAVCSTASLEDSFVGKLLIYPNPGSGKVLVELPAENLQIDQIAVYQTDARLVLTKEKQPSHQTQLDLENLPEGIYLIRVKAGHQYFTQRFQLVR